MFGKVDTLLSLFMQTQGSVSREAFHLQTWRLLFVFTLHLLCDGVNRKENGAKKCDEKCIKKWPLCENKNGGCGKNWQQESTTFPQTAAELHPLKVSAVCFCCRAIMMRDDQGDVSGTLLLPEIWIDIFSRLSQVHICHACFFALS